MTKPELKILEKCFEAEIFDHLPWQTGSKKISQPLQKLLDAGMIVPIERVLSGRFPLTCKGYRLTILGNLTWCEHCGSEE